MQQGAGVWAVGWKIFQLRLEALSLALVLGDEELEVGQEGVIGADSGQTFKCGPALQAVWAVVSAAGDVAGTGPAVGDEGLIPAVDATHAHG
jgi:hypothetical protein